MVGKDWLGGTFLPHPNTCEGLILPILGLLP